jgi:L-rhamnose mutarotase
VPAMMLSSTSSSTLASKTSPTSIFLDKETLSLFGVLKAEKAATLNDLPNHPIMQKWWLHMRDIMETNPDNSPLSIPLTEVFYLP